MSKIENKLALLDKREQRRNAATGETINTTPSLGSATGRSQILSMSLRQRADQQAGKLLAVGWRVVAR